MIKIAKKTSQQRLINSMFMQICYVSMFVCLAFLFSQKAIAAKAKSVNSANQNPPMASFINAIWQTNPGILSAQSEISRANAQFAQNRQPIYNPNINLDGEQIRHASEDDTYTAGLSQSIDLFNKRGARAQVGQYGLAEAQANLANQKLMLATKALKAIAEFRMAEAAVNLATRRTQLLYKFKELNERKFKSGDIAQDALDMASLAYAQAISQQADEEVILINAQQRLEAITDSSTKNWPKLPKHLPRPLQHSLATDKQWITALPLICVYNARVAIARAAIRVAQTETKADPTVSLRGGAEDKQLLVGLGFNMPLFVRNNFHDQVHAANYQAIAMEQARMNTYRQVKAALQGSLSRYQILYKATTNWYDASKHSLDGGVALLNRLWLAGELNTTNYLVQIKQRIDSQIAGVELTGKAWKEWFSVMESSGQLDIWLAKN